MFRPIIYLITQSPHADSMAYDGDDLAIQIRTY